MLTGPAFPQGAELPRVSSSGSPEPHLVPSPTLPNPLAAWLAPGAMRNLSELTLTANSLTGSLPPSLPWPALTEL